MHKLDEMIKDLQKQYNDTIYQYPVRVIGLLSKFFSIDLTHMLYHIAKGKPINQNLNISHVTFPLGSNYTMDVRLTTYQ